MRNWVLLFLVSTLLAGCQSRPKAEEKKVTYPDTSPPRTPFPRILSASPEVLSASNGTVSVGLLRVKYAIPTPERVTQAYLEVYNPAARIIGRAPVPIQAEGSVEWNVGANTSIGPAVRLRADCPNGYTEWVVLGLYRYPASTAQTYISNVTPKYIREPFTLHPEVGPPATAIEVWGAGFQPGCKVQASVNNEPPQELSTAYAGPSRLVAQLPWVGEVGSRYLELKLVIHGQGFDTENIFHIAVNDE